MTPTRVIDMSHIDKFNAKADIHSTHTKALARVEPCGRMEALVPVLQVPVATPFLRPRAVRDELCIYILCAAGEPKAEALREADGGETVILIILQFCENHW